jgi:hypothetical protein
MKVTVDLVVRVTPLPASQKRAWRASVRKLLKLLEEYEKALDTMPTNRQEKPQATE